MAMTVSVHCFCPYSLEDRIYEQNIAKPNQSGATEKR